LTLFPGIELSASSGFHLLAILDPKSTIRTISHRWARLGREI